MDLSINHITDWLVHYGYFAVILLVIVEGPIVTIISGFLISLKIFNPLLLYVIIVLSDLFSDCFCYAIGRWGGQKFIGRYGHLFGLDEKRVIALKKHFDFRGAGTLYLGKASHGIGGIFLVAAGLAKMPFSKFVWYNFVASLIKSFILLLTGYLFADAILKINNLFQFLVKISVGTVILVFVIYFYYYKKNNDVVSKS